MDKYWCLAGYALLTLIFWCALWVLDVTARAVVLDMERERGWLATQEAGVLLFGRLRVVNYLRSKDLQNSAKRLRRRRLLALALGVMTLSLVGVFVIAGWGHQMCAA